MSVAVSPTSQTDVPVLGVVLVTFNSTDVILECLETLLGSEGVALRVVVVDNASSDGTVSHIAEWMAGQREAALADMPFTPGAVARPITPVSDLGQVPTPGGHAVQIVETGCNLGFAGGVNRGLATLAAVPEIARFWVLNPDSVVPPGSAAAFATYTPPEGTFALMGGRVLYLGRPDRVQIDGGTITPSTGITGNLGLNAVSAKTPPSDPADMDFITGASMVASRAFYETVGPMREDYFLYYEEVDWAQRRGDLPLAYCAEGIVYHHGGTAIGSAVPKRPPTPFALYFKHRARMIFVRRFFPGRILTAHAWTLAKAAQYAYRGFRPEARALLAGALGGKPPATVKDRLSPETLELIFGADSTSPR